MIEFDSFSCSGCFPITEIIVLGFSFVSDSLFIWIASSKIWTHSVAEIQLQSSKIFNGVTMLKTDTRKVKYVQEQVWLACSKTWKFVQWENTGD